MFAPIQPLGLDQQQAIWDCQSLDPIVVLAHLADDRAFNLNGSIAFLNSLASKRERHLNATGLFVPLTSVGTLFSRLLLREEDILI